MAALMEAMACTGVSEGIGEQIAPLEQDVARLDTIPGVGRLTAEALMAEIGVDMRQFPSDRHLASWAGLCPGNNKSAGEHNPARPARAIASFAPPSPKRPWRPFAPRACPGVPLRRVMRHRVHSKAVVAVAHTILRAAYAVLADRIPYEDPGPDYFDRRHAARVTRRAVQALERQGYHVSVEWVA